MFDSFQSHRFFPHESFINGLDVLSLLTFVIYPVFASSSTLEGDQVVMGSRDEWRRRTPSRKVKE